MEEINKSFVSESNWLLEKLNTLKTRKYSPYQGV
jgi:hypothetical protein